jgi:hypothetical protein
MSKAALDREVGDRPLRARTAPIDMPVGSRPRAETDRFGAQAPPHGVQAIVVALVPALWPPFTHFPHERSVPYAAVGMQESIKNRGASASLG